MSKPLRAQLDAATARCRAATAARRATTYGTLAYDRALADENAATASKDRIAAEVSARERRDGAAKVKSLARRGYVQAYDPNQQRDERGRWSEGGGSGSGGGDQNGTGGGSKEGLRRGRGTSTRQAPPPRKSRPGDRSNPFAPPGSRKAWTDEDRDEAKRQFVHDGLAEPSDAELDEMIESGSLTHPFEEGSSTDGDTDMKYGPYDEIAVDRDERPIRRNDPRHPNYRQYIQRREQSDRERGRDRRR